MSSALAGGVSTSGPTGVGPLSIFFLTFFSCGPFLKSLLNLLQYCFCFMFTVFFFFWLWGMWDLTPITIKPAPLHWKQSLNLWTTREVSLYQFSEPVLQTKQFYPEQGINCQWFQEEPADSSEALAKLAQVSHASFSHFPAKPVLSNLRLDVHLGMTPNLCTTVFL